MAICASAVLQPDGTHTLRLQPEVIDVSACPYVVLSGGELANPFAMSAQDGFLVGGGIISVWVTAFFIKTVLNLIRGSANETA